MRSLKHGALLLITLWGVLSSNNVYARQAVWIDTDPACGHAQTDDVDDCWALLLALRSNELDLRGISTVFGNSHGEKTYRTAIELLRRFGDEDMTPAIYRGADSPLALQNPKITDASRALAKALADGPLTIIALGPLTNIATLLLNNPEQLGQINQVIAVAGQRPGTSVGFYPGNSHLFHLHDFNFRKDVTAFEIVLGSSVPMTLVPYEVATRITIQSGDLALLKKSGEQSQWLGEISQPWLEFWQTSLRTDGFYPFDSLAVGLLVMPSLFTCETISAHIQRKPSLFASSRDKLLVSNEFGGERMVRYCHDVQKIFKHTLIERVCF